MLGRNAIRRKSIYMVFSILLYINDIWSLDRLNRNGVSSEHISKEGEISDLNAIEGVYFLKETKSCKMSGFIKMT